MAREQARDNKKTKRLLSIDYFRGLAVLLMLVYDYVPFFTKNVPLILQHGRSDMLLPGDFVAPFFLFIMGVSLAISIHRQRAAGLAESKIFLDVLRRATILLVFGLVIDGLRAPLFGGTFGAKWGVIETLGVSYFISYCIMWLKPSWRVIAITTSLSLHLALLLAYPAYGEFVETSTHGSPASLLAWSMIAVFGMMAGERLARARRGYEHFLYWLAGILIVVGTGLALVIPPNKELVTPSYALITAGGSALLFMLAYYLIETKHVEWLVRRLRPLRELGVSALTAWTLQYTVGAYFIWYFHVNEKLSQTAGFTLAAAMIAVVWAIVAIANRRHLALRI